MSAPASAPAPDDAWQRREPQALGLDAGRLAGAVAFAEANEVAWSRDLGEQLARDEFEPPPWNEVIGPVFPRGGPAGVIVRGGCLAADWGDAARADLTFSVAKSYLAILAGIALRDGLIRDLDDPARDYALDDGFEASQNRTITWRQLLQMTSEWEGALWGKPDLIDRNRQLGAGADNSRKGRHRALRAPGSYWEYNDVRVTRLSLSLLQVFRRPLAKVMRDEIMRPIGASDGWTWHAYRNATFEIDGVAMPSVPGGTHWGGGLRIGARDQARLGELVLRRGCWGGRQILPTGWIDEMLKPCPINPGYGCFWWLNTERALYASAPASSVFAIGAGGNLVWVDFDDDLVAVTRWLDEPAADGFISRVLAAIV